MYRNKAYRALLAFTFVGVLLLMACGPDDSRPVVNYAGGGVEFSFREIDGLYNIPMDSLPWAAGLKYNAQNSPICYYFLSPAELSLSTPHIRVEYMSKSLPSCGTSDSVLTWLKDHFLVQQRGYLLTDKTPIETYSGKDAMFMEIGINPIQADSVFYPGKNMAWAYIEGDTSLIGMNFTAQDQAQYATGLVLFKELVMSYDEL